MTDEVDVPHYMDDVEHIRELSGMYIGSLPVQDYETFYYDPEKNKIVHGNLKYSSGAFSCIKEVINNAMDHYYRKGTAVSLISIDVRNKTYIEIANNGEGIKIEKSKETGLYYPQMYFTKPRSSSNYYAHKKASLGVQPRGKSETTDSRREREQEEKYVVGMYGIGVKATVAYSKDFILTTIDKKAKKYYSQRYSNNLREISEPKIVEDWEEEDSSGTLVCFELDWEKFGMKSMKNLRNEPLMRLVERYAYEIAAFAGPELVVKLYGEPVPVKGLADLGKMMITDPDRYVHVKLSKRTEIFIADAPEGAGDFVARLYVNGMWVPDIGSADHLIRGLSAVLNKYIKKKYKLDKGGGRNGMLILISMNIKNAQLLGQTKQKLETPWDEIKDWCKIPEKIAKDIDEKTDLVQRVLRAEDEKIRKDVSKAISDTGTKKRNITGIPKLEDARLAGTAKSDQCTLILTEGDSAKSFAQFLYTFRKDGRDYFGIFPLKGKSLNVTGKNIKTVYGDGSDKAKGNEEALNIAKIMNLNPNLDYSDPSNVKKLRYGHVMLMTDADYDGRHINALTTNQFIQLYPSLACIPGFLLSFLTPVVKVTRKGGKKKKEEKLFFIERDFERWIEENGGHSGASKNWEIKYYKGLATNTKQDAQKYFGSDFDLHKVTFLWEEKKTKESADLLFNSKNTDKRKEWLEKFDPKVDIELEEESTAKQVSLADYFLKSVIHFSNDDCMRSIPSAIDGFKPTQRKIIWTMLSLNITKSVKLCALQGIITKEMCYHHGDKSLTEAITKMAQVFLGCRNNLNLLHPDGMFGTRLDNGAKSAGSPRYISTYLEPWTKLLFPSADYPVLQENYEDGNRVEPVLLAPILPLVLINGGEGIGTGFNCYIPSYSVEDLLVILELKLKGKNVDDKLASLRPKYRGYIGEMEPSEDKKRWTSWGALKKVDQLNWKIMDIPVGPSLEKVNEVLEKAVATQGGILKGYEHDYDDDRNHYDLELSEDIPEDKAKGVMEKLGLYTIIYGDRLNAYSADGKLKHYGNVQEIFAEYYEFRLRMYARRKDYIMLDLSAVQLPILRSKANFIEAIIKGKISLNNKSDDEIEEILGNAKGVEKHPVTGNWDFLLDMKLRSLSQEKYDELKRELKELEAKLADLEGKSPEELWLEDLALLKNSF